MARAVTISCLSAMPLTLSPAASLEEIVERTVELWGQRLADVLPDRPDLVVLPEFADEPTIPAFGAEEQLAYYAYRGNRIRDFFAQIASENQCYIAYSSVISTADTMANCMQIVDRSGYVVGTYDKTHLVIHESENLGLNYGTGARCFDLDFGRVGCAICFDLNFDELLRDYVQAKPELLLFGSAYHGGLMQNYWAYSLRAYMAACVRPPAPSAVLSPLGEVLKSSTDYFPHVTHTVNLDYAVMHLDENRAKLSAAKKKYGPAVAIHDPGQVGAVMLTSESPDFTAQDVVSEYGIELLDEYLQRSRIHRLKQLASEAKRGA